MLLCFVVFVLFLAVVVHVLLVRVLVSCYFVHGFVWFCLVLVVVFCFMLRLLVPGFCASCVAFACECLWFLLLCSWFRVVLSCPCCGCQKCFSVWLL